MIGSHNLPDFDDEAPIRLGLAAKISFPDGSMSVRGLRVERDAGRLATEIIANKEYTTLGAIKQMRELCRVPARVSRMNGNAAAVSWADRSERPQTVSSVVDDAANAQAATAKRLAALKASFRNKSRNGQ